MLIDKMLIKNFKCTPLVFHAEQRDGVPFLVDKPEIAKILSKEPIFYRVNKIHRFNYKAS